MPQGARGWWVRAARIGLSAVLCAGAIGCMNTDSHKPPPRIGANPKNTTLPPPGLPGLQPLPNSTGTPVGTNTPRPTQPQPNRFRYDSACRRFRDWPWHDAAAKTDWATDHAPFASHACRVFAAAPVVPTAAPVLPPAGPGFSNPQGIRNTDPPPPDLSIPGVRCLRRRQLNRASRAVRTTEHQSLRLRSHPDTQPPAVYGEVSTGVYQMSK
ncbi:MAG: hypothetical protein U0792_06130 [Gemmataceae bacterium]